MHDNFLVRLIKSKLNHQHFQCVYGLLIYYCHLMIVQVPVLSDLNQVLYFGFHVVVLQRLIEELTAQFLIFKIECYLSHAPSLILRLFLVAPDTDIGAF